MSKGIFQSGSVGSCEKQSDVFHHIRYANSPRSSVPHKSIDIPKPLLTLEDYKEAKGNLEKRLKREGYDNSHKAVHVIAKALKQLLFFFLFLPFYLGFQLPLTIVSLTFSLLNRGLIKLLTPGLKVLDRFVAFVRQWAAKLDFQPLVTRVSSLFSSKKPNVFEEFPLEKSVASWKFWKNWALPQWKLSPFQWKIPAISLPKKLKNLSFSFPEWKISLKRLSSFKPAWKLSSFRWKLPKLSWKWNFKLSLPSMPKFSWKFPTFTNPLRWGAFSKIREKSSFKALRWDFRPGLEALKKKFSIFHFKKKEKKKKSRDIEAVARAFGHRIESGFEEFISVFPWVIQVPLQMIGQVVFFVFRRCFRLVKRLIVAFWGWFSSVYRIFARMSENLQKISKFTEKAKNKTLEFADKGVMTLSRPLVRTIETVHSKCIPLRLRFRRWTFLAGIVVELSLLFLSEAIIEFQDWNDARWISKFQ